MFVILPVGAMWHVWHCLPSRRAGLSSTRVWEIEAGRALRVSRPTVVRLAAALELPVERLEAAAGRQLLRERRPSP